VSGVAGQDDSTDEVHIDFSETVHINGPIEVSFHGPLPYFSEPQIEDIAPLLQFSGEIPDDRAEWLLIPTRMFLFSRCVGFVWTRQMHQ